MPKNSTALTSLDMHFLLQELRLLVGSRVNRIYAFEQELVLILAQKSEGKRILDFQLPENACILAQKQEVPEMPSGKAMLLRKYLEGAFFQGIEQIGFDRILKLSFSSRGTENRDFAVMMEFFSHGNWLLLDDKNRILGSLREEKWKDRTLQAGLEYVPPKPAVNLPALTVEALHSAIKSAQRDSIVKVLAIDLALGGSYSEELCARAGLDKTLTPADVSQKDAFLLHSSLKQMLQSHSTANALAEDSAPVVAADSPKGFVYVDCITPFPLISKQDSLKQELNSFLEARALFVKKKQSKYEKELEKAQLLLDSQRLSRHELDAQITENSEKAEWLYANFQAVSGLLFQLKSLKKEKNPSAVQAAIGDILVSNGLVESGVSGRLNTDNGILTLEVPDSQTSSGSIKEKKNSKGIF